jgi:polar amino acid transport system substrate-binding protein
MSNTAKIVIGVLVGLILVGICVIAAVLLLRPGGEEMEPTEVAATQPPVPGETEVVPQDAWERIKAAGKLIVGTSADYPPFEYYVDNLQIDGFDVALMDEIGRRLGLQVEYHDFAFDGLSGALQLGQVDVVIAAVSKTPQRESFVDFSSVYFVGEDAVLAREDENIVINTVDDMAPYRVGAQRGTVYDDFLHEALVQTGKMPSGNLFVYERAEDALRDLLEGRIDLIMGDSQPAQVAVDSGGVKIVGKGLNQQLYAIMLPKGEAALQQQIDQVLVALHNEGYMADLAQRYLEVVQLLPTPTPAATSTPAPPPACIPGMAFVKHMGPESGDATTPVDMKPGQSFTKVWRVKNTGTCTWDSNYQVVYGDGNSSLARMGGEPTAIQGQVAPGATYDIQVKLVAPLQSGVYYGFWEMRDADGGAFGERLPFNVRVTPHPTATPAPTQTPVPGIVFTVDRNQIKAGECVNFYWRVENVKEVYFFQQGQNWQDHGVVGEGNQKECPPVTTTYNLRVVKTDGSVETRQITVYVEPVAGAPAITRFTVDPPNQITQGQCVLVQWKVEGQVQRVTLTSNQSVLWDNAPVQGSIQDCPGIVGTVTYGIQASGPGGTSQGSRTITVAGPATATPAPTPPPELGVIYAFDAQPRQIPAGGCVDLSWSVGGGTVRVDINRGETRIMDGAPWNGRLQDCPEGITGEILYGVSVFNAAGREVWQQIPVQVGP